MPRLGLGVYQNYATQESVSEAFRVGYRHVDTAQAYRNEAHVANALRDSGLARGEVFITTKCISKTHGYESTLRAVDLSLERMALEYIDLFLIHDPYKGTEMRLQTYRALLDAQQAGKIRTVGVSNFGVKHLEEIREAGLKTPSVNQIELHPFSQQRPIVDYCHEHGIIVQAYSPLIRGKMDHPTFGALAKKVCEIESDLDNLMGTWFEWHGMRQYNRDTAQILLRWSLQHGYVPLPKSANPARIRSNSELYDFLLDDEDMVLLDGLDKGKNGAVTWNPVDVE